MDKKNNYLMYIIFVLVMLILVLVGYIFYTDNLFGVRDALTNSKKEIKKCDIVVTNSTDFVNKLNSYSWENDNIEAECKTYTVSYKNAKYVLKKVPEGTAGAYGFDYYANNNKVNFEKYNMWDFPTEYKIGDFKYYKLDENTILALYNSLVPGDIYSLYYSIIDLNNANIIEGIEKVSYHNFDETTKILTVGYSLVGPIDCDYINSFDENKIYSWKKEYTYSNGELKSEYSQETYGDLKLESKCN